MMATMTLTLLFLSPSCSLATYLWPNQALSLFKYIALRCLRDQQI